MKPPPATLTECGRSTARQNAVATAASTRFPPRSMISSPHFDE
jgi:hypothetical protein